MTKIDVSVHSAEAITATDCEDWTRLCSAHSQGHSPLLSIEFAKLIASVRPDVRFLLARQGGELVACMGIHLRPGGLARPVGAPFDDVCGPVIAPGVNLPPQELFALAGLRRFRANFSICLPERREDVPGVELPYVIDLRGGDAKTYHDTQRAAHPKRFKNFRRLASKMARERGELILEWGEPDARLGQLRAWKSAQFEREGLVDITTATYGARVLDAVAGARGTSETDVDGFMVSLMCGDALIAGHFGVRRGRHFHPWLSAYDPEFSSYGPGTVLLLYILSHLGQMGLETYNLATGHGAYKKYFAHSGVAVAPLAFNVEIPTGTSAIARLRRRIDHIATCEPGFAQRAKGLGLAIRRRGVPASSVPD